jgi:hypothetical protein
MPDRMPDRLQEYMSGCVPRWGSHEDMAAPWPVATTRQHTLWEPSSRSVRPRRPALSQSALGEWSRGWKGGAEGGAFRNQWFHCYGEITRGGHLKCPQRRCLDDQSNGETEGFINHACFFKQQNRGFDRKQTRGNGDGLGCVPTNNPKLSISMGGWTSMS